jgi:hypothetical protein
MCKKGDTAEIAIERALRFKEEAKAFQNQTRNAMRSFEKQMLSPHFRPHTVFILNRELPEPG